MSKKADLDRLSFFADGSKIGLILLAAGESRRLEGLSKQLLKYRGKSLVRHSAEIALASGCSPVCIVLGARSTEIQKEVEDLPVEIVNNQNWSDGMGASLKAGLERLLEIEPPLSAVVIQLCDQPFVTAETIHALIDAHKNTQAAIVACEYGETIGVPVLFSGAMFNELLNLAADGGAKRIIKKHLQIVEKILAPEAAIDIDTFQDYQRLKRWKV